LYYKYLKQFSNMKQHPIWKIRYNTAHYNYTLERTPNVVKDGFYTGPPTPVVTKSNGLTTFIINFLNWSGYRATRINTMGRQINGKFIPSATRKGTADISATVKGRSIMIEIKVGKDKPRPEQLTEQQRERQAGGIYEFVHTPEEFFLLFDSIVN
jgi:hypothetical protein